MRIRFIAELADMPFVRCMDTHVFLFIAAVCKAPLTGLESASERFFTCNKIQTLDKNTLLQRYKKCISSFTCMCPFMNFEVFCACELLWASKRALKGLFTRVHSHVIDQFILGLKRLPLTGTIVPETDVIRFSGSINVLSCQMRDEVSHCAVCFLTSLWTTHGQLKPLAGKPTRVQIYFGTVERGHASQSSILEVMLLCLSQAYVCFPRCHLFLIKTVPRYRIPIVCGVILFPRNVNKTPVTSGNAHGGCVGVTVRPNFTR